MPALGALEHEQLDHLRQSMRDIIEDLGTRPAVASTASGEADTVSEQEARTI